MRLSFLLLAYSMLGCVPLSVDDLPDAPSEIDFSETIDDQTGLRTAEKSYTFKDTGEELAFQAAKAALVHEDYEIISASPGEGAVFGGHGTSLVAGIYLNQLATDTQVRIVVKSAIALDPIRAPGPAHVVWDKARKLFDAMRLYIGVEAEARPDSTSQ